MSREARRVLSGIDRLLDDPGPIAGRRLGLITNSSALTSSGIPTWKALFESRDVRLARLFGPEHGVDGGAVYMEAVGDAVHPPTGLPVSSLYGGTAETLRPRPDHLAELDALLFDVADVGSRYYTFLWTMLLAMEGCAAAGKRFVVCDRANPIGGIVEGAPQEGEFLSFVGLHPVAVRHGMTAGEMARLLARERNLDLDLVVVPLSGWARNLWFDETGLAWVPPSPNMPSPATALVYPGMCLLEGTNLSEGRGTTLPFEQLGAPWLDALAFAASLNALSLPGVLFLPTHFRPQFEKHAGENCAGVLVRVTDRTRYRAFETGLRVIETARRLSGDRFQWRSEPYEFESRPAIDLLTGSVRFREAIERGADLREELDRHDSGANAFLPRREPFLLYPDRRPAAVALVGGHNAGKTTLIEELLPLIERRGFLVGAVKHTSRDAEDDIPGKDSQRIAGAGAAVSAFVTPGRTTSRRFGSEEPLEEVLAREFRSCDLVLVEGYKSLAFPRIEVVRVGAPRPLVASPAARISDGPEEADGVPTLRFQDHQGILEAVLRVTGLNRPGVAGRQA